MQTDVISNNFTVSKQYVMKCVVEFATTHTLYLLQICSICSWVSDYIQSLEVAYEFLLMRIYDRCPSSINVPPLRLS